MNQFPGFMQMQPMQKQPSIGQMGMQMMQAALARQRAGQSATPEVPQGGTLPGGAMNLVPAAQANPGGMGLLSGIINKLKGPQQNIDPNTGLPVTADVMAGAADLGGAGPAPNAISGLW